MSALALITDSYPHPPALDTCVSHEILRQVAAGTRGDTLRLHVPARVVAFGRQDVVSPGYERAVTESRRLGYGPVERLAGGRAALFHEGTLAFAWARASSDPRLDIARRFDEVAGSLAEALRALGVDARIGELPGEYCPGAYSIHGRAKLVGIGQRLIRGAAHVGGVIVVTGATEVRRVLTPVYDALELSWDPRTAGAVEDEVAGITLEDVAASITRHIGSSHDLVSTPLDEATLAAAHSRLAAHEPSM